MPSARESQPYYGAARQQPPLPAVWLLFPFRYTAEGPRAILENSEENELLLSAPLLGMLVAIVACMLAKQAGNCSPLGTPPLPRALLAQIDADFAPFQSSGGEGGSGGGGITAAAVEAAFCLPGQALRVQIIGGRLHIAGETPSFQSRALSMKMMLHTLLQRVAKRQQQQQQQQQPPGNVISDGDSAPFPDVDFVLSLHDFPPPATTAGASRRPGAAGATPAPPALPSLPLPLPLPLLAMGRTAAHAGVVLVPDHTFWNWREAGTDGWARQREALLEAGEAADANGWARRAGAALFAGAPTAPVRSAAAEAARRERREGRSAPPPPTPQQEDQPPVPPPPPPPPQVPPPAPLLDVRIHEQDRALFVPLPAHCGRRYLLHLPGISYSARLKYLLLCGAAVVAPGLALAIGEMNNTTMVTGGGAAAGGSSLGGTVGGGMGGGRWSQQRGHWFEFWYGLLVPGVHFVDSERPLARAGPSLERHWAPAVDGGTGNGVGDRLVAALRALRAEDEAGAAGEGEGERRVGASSTARRVAEAGRALVREELTMETVWAYWEAVLRRYAAAQRFAPRLRDDALSFADSLLDEVPPTRVRCAAADDASAAFQ